MRCESIRTRRAQGNCGQHGGKKATIVGTPGNDRIVGKKASDVIYGGGGGGNSLNGGVGNDNLNGGGGPDEAFGGAGSDDCAGFAVEHSCGLEPIPPGGGTVAILNQGLDGASLIVQGRRRLQRNPGRVRRRWPGDDTVSYGRSKADLRVELGGTGAPSGCGRPDQVRADNESDSPHR